MRANERKEYASLPLRYKEFIDLMSDDIDWSQERFYIKKGDLYITSIRITNRNMVKIPSGTHCEGYVFIANCGLVFFEGYSTFREMNIEIRSVNRLSFGSRNLFSSNISLSEVKEILFGYNNAFFCNIHVYNSSVIQMEECFNTGISAVFVNTTVNKPPKVVQTMLEWDFMRTREGSFFKSDDVEKFYIIDTREREYKKNEYRTTKTFLIVNGYLWTLDKWMQKYTIYKIICMSKEDIIKGKNLFTGEVAYICIAHGVGFVGETAMKAKKMASMMLSPGEVRLFDDDYMRRVGGSKKIPFTEAMKAYIVLSDSNIVNAVLLVRNNGLITKEYLSFIDLFGLHDSSGGVKRLEERFNSLKQ